MSRMRECSKHKFAEADDAERSAAAVAVRRCSGDHLVVYWCRGCVAYHWGHAFGKIEPSKGKRKKEYDLPYLVPHAEPPVSDPKLSQPADCA
jgi:hypothetical protein